MGDGERAGSVLMRRAVELDNAGRYEEALSCYQTGIEQLLSAMKGITDTSKKNHFRERITEYMKRAENLKKHISKLKDEGKYHEQNHIENNSTGHSYRRLFGHLLDPMLTTVEVDDPYIRSPHQIYNFLKFCETLVNSEAKVTSIKLTTGLEERADEQRQQKNKLEQIGVNLQKHGVKLHVAYSDTLHDREIRLNNGWIVKIGRGLDYFKPPENKFCLGYFDMDLRPCHETTVDIFHTQHTRQAAAD